MGVYFLYSPHPLFLKFFILIFTDIMYIPYNAKVSLWKTFTVFADIIGNRETFPVKFLKLNFHRELSSNAPLFHPPYKLLPYINHSGSLPFCM